MDVPSVTELLGNSSQRPMTLTWLIFCQVGKICSNIFNVDCLKYSDLIGLDKNESYNLLPSF